MDAHEYGIAVAIDELNHLLRLAVHAGRDESAEASDAMVGMYHVVAYLQLVELLQGHQRLASSSVVRRQCHAVVTLEYLMVGVAGYLPPVVNPAAMQRVVNGREQCRLVAFDIRQTLVVVLRYSRHDCCQTVGLLLVVGEDIYRVAARQFLRHILHQHLELFVEQRLWQGVERYARVAVIRTFCAYLYRLFPRLVSFAYRCLQGA